MYKFGQLRDIYYPWSTVAHFEMQTIKDLLGLNSLKFTLQIELSVRNSIQWKLITVINVNPKRSTNSNIAITNVFVPVDNVTDGSCLSFIGQVLDIAYFMQNKDTKVGVETRFRCIYYQLIYV